MHDELEDILYSTTMAVSKELSPEKLTELKNTVADLEKEVLALGAVAASDELVTGDAGAIPPESAGSASETEPEENR